MQLYNKIQELIKLVEKSKAENMALAEHARNTLSKHIEAQIRTKGKELESVIETRLEQKAQSQEIQEAFKQALHRKLDTKLQELDNSLKKQVESKLLAKFPIESMRTQTLDTLKHTLSTHVEQLQAQYQAQAQEQLEQSAQHLIQDFQGLQRDLLTNLGSDTKLATDAFFKEQERVLQYQFQERLQAFEHSLEQSKAQVIQA
ncbi:hypothetical protein, partial [Helicobacter salomonis]|uniref:hypothetical protein n=1 Tax=Helicobacter salomonis TaxID=56878 RepID=UPI00131523FD